MDSGRNENENKEDERTNEKLIPGSEMHTVNSCIYEVCRSICKIITPKKVGTGFFIKLYKNDEPLFSLMTNEHIVEKDMIEKKRNNWSILWQSEKKNKNYFKWGWKIY